MAYRQSVHNVDHRADQGHRPLLQDDRERLVIGGPSRRINGPSICLYFCLYMRELAHLGSAPLCNFGICF